jgi:NAD(P)-dependent dehydrogenase (short-subunit alcohol dehydrogenase family)
MSSKVVLITGCSTGIGRDLAQRLARAKYTVAATARHPESLSGLPVALQLPLDVTDQVSIESATEEVIKRFGRIDVLVNNAGYAVRGAVEDIPIEQVQQMFDVNVYGVMLCAWSWPPLAFEWCSLNREIFAAILWLRLKPTHKKPS